MRNQKSDHTDSDDAEDAILSMAMIKEKQRDKCGSVNKKGRNNSSSSSVGNNGTLKTNILENDIDIREDSFGIADDIMDKVSNRSPVSITCSFVDQKNFAMDMCPVDAKLDGNTFVNSNLSACKSQVKTDDIISTNAEFSPDFILDAPLSSCKPHKTDDAINADPVFPPDSCDGMLPTIPMTMGSSEPLVDGVQPLTSNIVNKQPSAMDAQYMQQQSQVFVFSTTLANKAAEAVIKGQFKSIIAYHCAQPKTKKYLERHPLKMNQFTRQNSNQWLNNYSQMKQKSVSGNLACNVNRAAFRNNPMMSSDMLNSGSGGSPAAGMNMPPRLPMWNQQGNMNPMNVNNNNPHGPMISPMCNNNIMAGGPPSGPMQSAINTVLPGQIGPNSAGLMHSGIPMKCQSQSSSSIDIMSDTTNTNQLLSNNVLPPLGNFSEDQFPLSPHTSLSGVKVPDENLTPKQRLHREDKLACLRKIGEILLPENHQSPSYHSMNSEISASSHNPISVDDISCVLGGNDSTDMPMQKTAPNAGGTASSNTGAGNGGGNGNGGLPADWQKMQPFFDDRKRMPDVNNMNRCGSRSQGPPPPYHQTTRSASVPIAVPSPNPNSPGNATSNLSLPSPRTCSGLNSPASKQGPGPSPTTNQLNTSVESPGPSHSRVNISNPGTPVSSNMHLSPNSKQKENKMCTGPLPNEFSPAASGQQSPDGIFCRSLQSLARQQQQKQQPQLPHAQQMQPTNSHCKEPNLMPVPSPQHIQYLSTFEGQELTIQKQPNTSLKDSTSIVSPSLSNASLDTMIPVSTDNSCSKVSVSAPNTPLTPSSLDLGSTKYAGTPGDFTALSPSADGKSQLRNSNSNQLKNDLRFSCSSPQLTDQQRFQPTTTNYMSQTNKNTFLDASSPEKLSCSLRSDSKEPLNPSCSNNFPRMIPNNVPIDPTAAPKPSFDPISSLAQMSQQLTNNVPGSPGNQVGMMHSGMMPYNAGGHMPNNMNMMQMNEMGMCGAPTNEPPIQDGSRMVFNSQMPPSVNMGMNSNVASRMMPCPNPNENGGLPKPGNMPGPYPPMMSGNPNRMMRPPGSLSNSYNGANIQVKPNAPNTIQYLPNRPQSANVGARGPPSLEFLRYQNQNPMSNMDNKMQPHNMNYFQNNYSGPGNSMNDMMGNMNCGMPPGNPMVRPPMRGVNPGPPPPPNMMRMSGGNMGMPPYNEQMYPQGGPNPPNMPSNNCHMFMPNQGSKMPPGMNMAGNVAPDASQPLPPSMGQANNFKNSPFMGSLMPEMSDPQYRQQFHNFQQQLYATNTRSTMNMNNQPMSGL